METERQHQQFYPDTYRHSSELHRAAEQEDRNFQRRCDWSRRWFFRFRELPEAWGMNEILGGKR